jgi:hypothetical protein
MIQLNMTSDPKNESSGNMVFESCFAVVFAEIVNRCSFACVLLDRWFISELK